MAEAGKDEMVGDKDVSSLATRAMISVVFHITMAAKLVVITNRQMPQRLAPNKHRHIPK